LLFLPKQSFAWRSYDEILSGKSRNLRSPILAGWVQDDKRSGPLVTALNFFGDQESVNKVAGGKARPHSPEGF
jgi:hypothetical protein